MSARIDDKQEVYFRDNGCCVYCGKLVFGRDRHIDHVIPVCKGGSDFFYNLVTACHECNEKKRDLLLPVSYLRAISGHDDNRFVYLSGLRELVLTTPFIKPNRITFAQRTWLPKITQYLFGNLEPLKELMPHG